MKARDRLAPLLLVSVAVVAILVLRAADLGLAEAPPIDDPAAWAAWLAESDPMVVALAAVRLAGLALAWYLMSATVVGVAVRLAATLRPSAWARGSVALADRFTIGPLQRMLTATAGLSLIMSGPTAAVAAGPPGPGPLTAATVATATTVVAEINPADPIPTTGIGGPPPTITMRLVVPTSVPAAPTTLTVPPVPPVPPTGERVLPPVDGSVPPPVDPTLRWTVKRGECFWSIADDVLSRERGTRPTDAEIVPYWQSLIELNRHRLVDRANADLIYPGQEFEIPPAPLR